jgi:hypothetical protein
MAVRLAHPSDLLADALAAARVTSADLEAFLRSAKPESGVAAGLVSSSTSGPCPGDFESYAEYLSACAVDQAFLNAVAGIRPTPVEYPAGQGGHDVEPQDNDILIDSAAVRIDRMRSMLLSRARLIQSRLASSGARWKAAFLTATYADDQDDFDARQISILMKHIRRWAKRRGFTVPYLWVLERGEKRGRLHYHVVVWLPKGYSMPKPDKQGWWRFGSTNIQWARHAPVGYLAKYMGKGGPSDLPMPKGARLHGSGGMTAIERAKVCWLHAPAWVREHWDSWDLMPRRATGGGWVSRVLGDWLPSPYQFVGMFRGRPVIRPIGLLTS